MGLHNDLSVLIQRYQKAQKTFHGELPEVVANIGNVTGANPPRLLRVR